VILYPGAELKFCLRAEVRAVSRAQAEGMTEFDAVTVRGLRKRYRSGVVVDRLDLDVSRVGMAGLADADGAGKTITVGCIQGPRRPGDGALRVLGYIGITGAAQLRPLIGSQLQGSALPHRVARARDLLATSPAHDGTELREQFGLGEPGRWGFSPLAGRERRRLFVVLALPGWQERTS
jgi:ABC-2 type transport system ATP-binding protein